MDLTFVLEVNRGNGWEPTSWPARCLRAAYDLREWVKQQFPTYKYRVVSVLSDKVSPYKWEPVLAGPYQFPYRLSLSDEEYAQVTTPVQLNSYMPPYQGLYSYMQFMINK